MRGTVCPDVRCKYRPSHAFVHNEVQVRFRAVTLTLHAVPCRYTDVTLPLRPLLHSNPGEYRQSSDLGKPQLNCKSKEREVRLPVANAPMGTRV